MKVRLLWGLAVWLVAALLFTAILMSVELQLLAIRLFVLLLLLGSVIHYWKLWRARKSRVDLYRVAHSGWLGVLPASWARWLVPPNPPEERPASKDPPFTLS